MDNDNSKLYAEILDKKLDGYDVNKDNFLSPGELRVTISLNEYRKLVGNDATRQQAIKKAEDDKYIRENEIKSLKEENARLKGENYDLKKELDDLKAQVEQSDGKDCCGDA